MAQTLLRGTQIQPGTITAALLVAGLGLATSQLADGAKMVFTDGTRSMTASLNLGGFTATNSGTPVNGSDLVTKSYADAIKTGFKLHFARVVGVSNIASLSGLQTIDGYTTVAGDIVLLTGQTTGSQNGLWVVASGSWTRPPEWPAAGSLSEGQYIIIDADGSTYKNTKFFCTNTGTITVDTTATTFVQDSSGTTYSNGNGLSLTGTTFAVKLGNGLGFDGSNNVQGVADPSRNLQVTSSGIGIKDGTAGQVLLANASGNAAYATVSGDATLASTGALTLASTVVKYSAIVSNETPGGTVNGTNTAFTLANAPQAGSLSLELNGATLEPGTGNDYTISGTAITMLFAPLSSDKLRAYYFK